MNDKTIDKQEQIIKIAMQLFAVKGSSSTSMQEIAELCGISKGSLYLVFKSKEELERSIFLYCYRMIRDPLLREEQETRRTPREKQESDRNSAKSRVRIARVLAASNSGGCGQRI